MAGPDEIRGMMMGTTRTSDLAGISESLRSFLERFMFAVGDGAPTSGATGAGGARPGSVYLNRLTGTWYYNSNTLASPTWTAIGATTTVWGASKFPDSIALGFGTATDGDNPAVFDRSILYDPTNGQWTFEATRSDATTLNYERGLVLSLGANDDFFCHTGARKSWGLVVGGDRPDTAVMGGDANDMLIKADYTNYAVNTPAGSYARGLSVQMTNRTLGVLSALQGGFIGVRQRSSGDVASLEGLQIDCKIDSGMGAPSSEISGLRVELNLCANAPAASYGVVVRNLTDGVYTLPTAAFKAYQDGTSSCKGFSYGLDLLSSSTVKTVDLGEIRFSQTDAAGLPCVLFTGTGTSDGEIVTDVGADTLWADGCVYISVVDGAGTIWQKRNDTWTAF